MILSLIGQAWPWWLLTSGMLLWPSRRSAIMLTPIALGIGVAMNTPAPAIAIAAGSAAWALGWWGGADSIATAITGLLVMLFRRRAFIGLLSVLPEAIELKARDSVEIPAEAEMPAAAALAVPGMLLSAYPLIILLTRGLYA